MPEARKIKKIAAFGEMGNVNVAGNSKIRDCHVAIPWIV